MTQNFHVCQDHVKNEPCRILAGIDAVSPGAALLEYAERNGVNGGVKTGHGAEQKSATLAHG